MPIEYKTEVLAILPLYFEPLGEEPKQVRELHIEGITRPVKVVRSIDEELDKYGKVGWDVYQIETRRLNGSISSHSEYHLIRMKRQISSETVQEPRDHKKT